MYYKGIELANGFHELTDAREQQQRFEQDNRKRAARGLPQQPIDQNLLDALAAGLPDCSGVALGVDRLVMLALGAESGGRDCFYGRSGVNLKFTLSRDKMAQ